LFWRCAVLHKPAGGYEAAKDVRGPLGLKVYRVCQDQQGQMARLARMAWQDQQDVTVRQDVTVKTAW
jgi:hypothetical protein